ncbi:MAG TPA: Na+/H+ antiporter subunit B [Phycisphaerae bacterium]|nr:Na+/H+ antiporter subunit B [Phycisphaerae bacterium]HOB73048.1 Na+/H+ antiporter subunit B [Phycisphaerae bacterium]HOJ54071.1 Na+/H+ antiporter subunit B [Phycisphaerae bacterium]HOL26482.1 Na+/H+ antiporter subunit B [Phycisphaerae bacterium]HPP20461.1 Na+/H+ antiporter subunit B [Phycisphaerae bacterium]
MKSCILSTATRYLLPLMLLFSIYLLLRGHNQPGGGFVGGLVASTAFALYMIAEGVLAARRALQVQPTTLIGIGLGIAAASGGLDLLAGEPFLKGLWLPVAVPVLGKIGTPLMFDAGVYLVVLGVALLIVFSMAED